MLASLIAYDTDGNVVATSDYLIKHDPATGELLGFEDFAANEEAGRPQMPDPADPEPWRLGHGAWTVNSGDPAHPVKGSKVWPEWLGGRTHEFRVELTGEPGRKRISALVHKVSGYRRERAAVEAAIVAVEPSKGVRDIRHIVGGPDRPLELDSEGHTAKRSVDTPSHLPLVGSKRK